MPKEQLGFSGNFYVEDNTKGAGEARFSLQKNPVYELGASRGNFVTNGEEFLKQLSVAASCANPVKVHGLAEKLDSGLPAVSSPVKILSIKRA